MKYVIKFLRCICVITGLITCLNAYSALPVCQKASQACTNAVSINYSRCRINNYGQESACATKYTQQLNQCSAALSGCTETYILPKADLVSILYMPPGDKSTVGHSAGQSKGTVETYGTYNSYQNIQSASANVFGLTLDSSVTIGQSSSFERSVTKSVQSTSGTTWTTLGNPIDHSSDVMTIWLNPHITEAIFSILGNHIPGFTDKGLTVNYTDIGNSRYDPLANSMRGELLVGTTTSQGNASMISVRISSLVQPKMLLPSQLVSRTTADGAVIPGLLSLCENRLPEAMCTLAAAQQNACGCTSSDFAFLVNQHPFFDPNVANHSVQSINAVDPNYARFVPVKDVNGNDLSVSIQSGVTKTFSITNIYNTSQTYTNKEEFSSEAKVGFSYSILNAKTTFKRSMTASVGKSLTTGKSNTQSVALSTSSSSCYGYVNVYEDTLFHTFLFTNSSNAPNPCP